MTGYCLASIGRGLNLSYLTISSLVTCLVRLAVSIASDIAVFVAKTATVQRKHGSRVDLRGLTWIWCLDCPSIVSKRIVFSVPP